MKNTTHRVVILKNINSDIISQAILILKNAESVSESAVLADAEMIVEKYMNKSTPARKEKGGRTAAVFICAAAVLFTGLWIFAIIKMLR